MSVRAKETSLPKHSSAQDQERVISMLNGVVNPLGQSRLPSRNPSVKTAIWTGKWKLDYTSSTNKYVSFGVSPSMTGTLGICDTNNIAVAFGPQTWRTSPTYWGGAILSFPQEFRTAQNVITPTLMPVPAATYAALVNNELEPDRAWLFPNTVDLVAQVGDVKSFITNLGRNLTGMTLSIRVFDANGALSSTTVLYTSSLNLGNTTVEYTLTNAAQVALVAAINAGSSWGFFYSTTTYSPDLASVSNNCNLTFAGSSDMPKWTFLNFGQIIDSDGLITEGEVSNAIKGNYDSYPRVRVNALTATLTNTSEGDAASGALVGTIVPSGSSLRSYSSPSSVFNAITQINNTATVSSKLRTGANFPYLRDSDAQWDFVRTDYPALSTYDAFVNFKETFYPHQIYGVKQGVIPNAVGFYATQVQITIEVCLEFVGTSLRLQLAYPPGGWVQYTQLYEELCIAYRCGIGENPRHLERARSILKMVAANPYVQDVAKAAWTLTKVGAAAAITLI